MERELIISMAQEADIDAEAEGLTQALERFADLVAAYVKSDQINTAYQQGCEDMKRRMEKRMQQLESQLQLCQTAVADERELCAKVCDDRADGALHAAEFAGRNAVVAAEEATECAAAIRGRGEK